MKNQFCRILTAMGLAVLVFTGALAFWARELPAVILSEPKEAVATVQAFLNELNRGELSQAGRMLYGQPNLDGKSEFENPVVAALWRAYTQSLQGCLTGSCYGAEDGLYQDVTITALDIQGILPLAECQYEALLPQRSLEQGNGAINLEDGTYRKEFVLSVLEEAVQSVLTQEPLTVSRTVSLPLVYREKQWWILPQSDLMDILAGGMAVRGD